MYVDISRKLKDIFGRYSISLTSFDDKRLFELRHFETSGTREEVLNAINKLFGDRIEIADSRSELKREIERFVKSNY